MSDSRRLARRLKITIGVILYVAGVSLLYWAAWIGYVAVTKRSDTAPGSLAWLAIELAAGGGAAWIAAWLLLRPSTRRGGPANR